MSAYHKVYIRCLQGKMHDGQPRVNDVGRPGNGGPSPNEAFVVTAVLVQVDAHESADQLELGREHVDTDALLQGNEPRVLLAPPNETSRAIEKYLVEDIGPEACRGEGIPPAWAL